MPVPDDLTLLVECGNPVEVAGVKSLLEANGIPHVVQGEQHAAMLGGVFGSTIISPRVLVAARDLEKAKAVLAATPVLQGTVPETGASLEGAVCPVHEAAAIATCGRCGTFLCERCNSLGNPPVCEECLAQEQKTKPEKGMSKVTFFVLALLLIAPALLWRFGCAG